MALNKLQHWTIIIMSFSWHNIYMFPVAPINVSVDYRGYIAALNRFPGCEKSICKHQKHISTLFGSKVMVHYVEVVAILGFACKRTRINSG